MKRTRLFLLAGTALVTTAGAAVAQTAPTPNPAPAQAQAPQTGSPGAATNLGDVVVTARTTEVRSSIDSTSYSLANDLQASSGSLADALRNVPSVEVDPQGNVSLRGDPDVTVLVDGRPSGVLTGEGRAQAILQLSASGYSRIEVMTNPSAAYSPEGSGGVINLITRPNVVREGAAITGSVRANGGDNGRWNVGANGTWAQGGLTLSGDLNLRKDLILQETDRLRHRLDPVTGAIVQTTRQTQDVDGYNDVQSARFSAQYDVDPQLTLSAEFRGAQIDNGASADETYETADGTGALAGRYVRDRDVVFDGDSVGVTSRILRRFAGDGHEWTNELRVDRNRNAFSLGAVYHYDLPAAPDLLEQSYMRNSQALIGFTSGYTRPMTEGGKVRAGYEFEARDVSLDNATSRGPTRGTLLPDPSVTNRFQAEQAVHAAYVTWERPMGNLTAQLGLRLEYADLQLNQITTGMRSEQDYFRAYPTLHLGYQLTDAQQLKASYSRRIQRPSPGLLNPFTTDQDPLNRRSGNPDLVPQETDAFEVMWQMRSGQTFYQATAYFRDTRKAFTDLVTDAGGFLLTRPENLGSRRDTGLELVANGALHATLRYSASVNVFRQEIDAGDLVAGVGRSATMVAGRANLNWQPTPGDFLQVSAIWPGDVLQAQGIKETGSTINLGYRHTLTPKLAFQATVRDVFSTYGDTSVYETSTFRDRSERSYGGRAWYVGLTYTFGQAPRRTAEPQFDFQAPPGGG
ncbi:TonB-dependent receptor domain-containing protein [Brevundimonas sp.]|uniref:TonB-dependent receptor domain-containing protein n=1 Tax=Brevundimonas sp. TaxID=1871086 RepID=UPI00286A8F1D|nr:TonB-dependent receptor [Brevundimonas sp.]